MRKFYVVGLALFSVFAFCAAAVGSASAAEVAQWLVSGNTIALGTSVNVDITGTLLLEDMGKGAVEIAGNPDMLCLGITGLGFILSNGEGEITERKCGSFEVMKGTCNSPSFTPVDLPWLTQVEQMSNGIFLTTIKEDGKGAPGWSANCTDIIKIEDTCTSNNETAELKNITLGEENETFFPEEPESKTEWYNCSVGGNEEGLVVGELLLTALPTSTELLALTVSLAPEVS